ncbi:Gfo/Idh/MocA family oxidoreductase [Streptomyces sp. NPDC005898]|uniref:Gfo/Idh/MocA family protein n=1 Tax=Streptomyces sp. NPDC005898 TaxID=3157082 RepID=UPI0033D28EE6
MSAATGGLRLPLPVVLAGARGHGGAHLENIRRLQRAGLVRLVGVCELKPLVGEELVGFGAVEQSDDLAALLDATGAAVAVICTPIPTHADLALAAARRGVHVLLEKPPAPSYAQFRQIADAAAAAGTAVQIGFQSLGSHALPAIRRLITEGAIGEVTGVGGAGLWVRDEAYFRRAPWAGRRRLDGLDVVDGVLTNPLAHAVAGALALAGSTAAEDVTDVECELFRAHAIESDDTSCVRISTADGGRVTVAATLCAPTSQEPYVVVHGTEGRVTCWYRHDRVQVRRGADDTEGSQTLYGRTDLLENLVQHLMGRAELLVPPAATGAFMRVVEAVRLAPGPAALPADAWHRAPGQSAERRVVPGIEGLVALAADTQCLYSELGASWARPSRPGDLHDEVNPS